MARQGAGLGDERLTCLQAGPRRPEGIVLLHGGDAEHAHQVLAVAGGQLSAVPFEYGGQGGRHVLVHGAVRLGIEPAPGPGATRSETQSTVTGLRLGRPTLAAAPVRGAGRGAGSPPGAH